MLTVGGVVDLATAPTLQQTVDGLVDSAPPILIMDLSAVEFLASVGLQILVTTHEKVCLAGQFAVVAAGAPVSRPIQLTHLDELVPLYSTLDEAIAALGH